MIQPCTMQSQLPQLESVAKYSDNRGFTNPIAEGVHAIGTLLTSLMSSSLEHGARAVFKRPQCNPVRQGSAIEDGRRYYHLFLFALKGLISLATLMLPVGACMRTFATLFRGDFSYYHPIKEGDIQRALAQSQSRGDGLKVLAYNICAMPGVISYRNGLAHPMERMDLIVQEIQDSDADVVCIQEAFHADFSEELVRRVQQEYPFAICNVGMHSFGLSSGNMILSRHPISKAMYEKFRDRGGMDQYARKGPLAVTVEKKNQKYNIVTTHFNGGAPAKEGSGKRYRRSQITQTVALAKTFFQRMQEAPTILAADTNIVPLVDEEYSDLEKVLDLVLSEEVRAEGTEIDMQTGRYKKACPDHIGLLKIDSRYQLAKNSSDWRVDKYQASDHAGHIAHLHFK